MINIKQIKQYISPVLCMIVLTCVLVLGIFYIRLYMSQQAAAERSAQLEQISSQIKANLEYGLENHWNLVSGLEGVAEGKHYSDEESLEEDISRLEKEFTLDLYGCRLMFLDSQGAAYFEDGARGIWDDINRLADGEKRHTFVSETSNIEGTYLAFVQKLDTPAVVDDDGMRFTHVVLLKNIDKLKKYYITESYGGHTATYIVKENGVQAFYDADDDIIGARNVFKALSQAEYLNDQTFDQVKEKIRKDGIVSASIMIEDTEYFYCLTSLKQFDMYLMLLIPAEFVAANTMNMMNSFIRILIIFVSVLILLLALVFVSFVIIQRRKQMVQIEKENNRELNRLHLAAENARADAELANKAKTSFLNNMSHDIRTPMNAIIGFTNIALKQNPNPEVDKCLHNISSSSEHLLTIINDVLDISRIESGKIKFVPIPTDISSVADTVLNIMQGFLSDRNIVFRTKIMKPDYPFVLADVVRIREILVNILGNAVKFTEDGGTICFDVEYLSGEDESHIVVRYRVSDTGVGMTPEFVDHIFDEFSQEDNGARTQYKGTGLGMAITRRYIDLMDGTITVASTKGEGSVFTVEIPLELTDETRVVKQESDYPCADLMGVHVLLAEDNDLNAEIAVVQLEEMGVKVTRAVDGKEAFRLFAENSPGTFDMIFMDIMMPEMNGYEATAAIRSIEGRADAAEIPIIAMTANAFAEDVQASINAGMNGHIAKPIVMEEVLKSIAINLNR